MLKKKYTAEKQHQIVEESRKSSIHAVAKKYEIGTTTLREWIAKYEFMGIAGLQEAVGRSRRTEAEKQEVVLTYVQSNQSLEDVCKRFKIRSKAQLRDWIKQYNSHEKLETTSSGGGIFMTKGRVVTFEEKVEIVPFCMANGKDYILIIFHSSSFSFQHQFEQAGDKIHKSVVIRRQTPYKQSKPQLTAVCFYSYAILMLCCSDNLIVLLVRFILFSLLCL